MGKVTEQLTENKTKGKKLRVYCPDCKREKAHIVVVSADMEASEEFSEDSWISSVDNYQVIQCQCGNLSFRHLNWFSEYQDYDWSGHTERLYPKVSADSWVVKEFGNVPQTLRRIYRESIETFNNECFTLCAAGLRGIVEGICAAQSVKDGPIEIKGKDGVPKTVRSKKLDGKIAGLCEKGILTKACADHLHEHRFLGNDAVHELAQPSAHELKLAIEIIEHTLEQLYEIPEKAKRLNRERAYRKSRD